MDLTLKLSKSIAVCIHQTAEISSLPLCLSSEPRFLRLSLLIRASQRYLLRPRSVWPRRLSISFLAFVVDVLLILFLDDRTMNTLSIRDLCCLFCCPPLPSRIAAKLGRLFVSAVSRWTQIEYRSYLLAFLPPEPTYSLHVANTAPGTSESILVSPTKKPLSDSNPALTRFTITFSEKAEWQHSAADLARLEAYYVTTARNNRIACFYVKCTPDPKYHILFSHGNAVDLGKNWRFLLPRLKLAFQGQMASFFLVLGTRLQCNIISYDYSGYGVSQGKPSEKNMYADIEATYKSMKQRYHIPDSRIILYGQSIGEWFGLDANICWQAMLAYLGTVPTIDLASRHSDCCAACILHSPLTSGMRVAFPDTKRTWCCDAFPSIDKIHRIRSIVLIIHGTEDDVIDVSHGFALYNRVQLQHQIEPLWIDGAGHNDIEVSDVCLFLLR